jgi:photosystem II stability/assembly factor-like uncharacterized protein
MRLLFLFLLHSTLLFSQDHQIVKVNNTPECSFRGLSIVNDSLAWLSGSKGSIGFYESLGEEWKFFEVKGYETFDFRSIHGFSKRNAVIANAGSPAVILITKDSSSSWKEVYRNEHKDAFIDGLVFWNEMDGLAFGDPINSRMFLLRTNDGGISWKEIPEKDRPLLSEGEAAFAASGTTIRYLGEGKIVIATGGKTSRLWISTNYGSSWKHLNVPILQGESSTGIFSFAFRNKTNGVIVGGDYTKDTLKTNHVFITKDGGKTWQRPNKSTGGYRSCVEYLDEKTIVATGTSGTDISFDEGKNWQELSNDGYNVVQSSGTGNLVILAGGNGKLAVLKRK